MLRAAALGVSIMTRPPGATTRAIACANARGDGTCSITSMAVTSGNCCACGESAYCSTVPVNTSSPKRWRAYSAASDEISTPRASHPRRFMTAGR